MSNSGAAHTGSIRITELDSFKAFGTRLTATWEDGLNQYKLKGQQVLIMQTYLTERGKIKCSLLSQDTIDNWKQTNKQTKKQTPPQMAK